MRTPVNPEEIKARHKKQLVSMRSWLDGKNYWKASEALELVRELEEGTRKDGVTPKFHHQLSVARLLSTLEPHLLYPEETITVAFLHDVLEDHGGRYTREYLEEKFGKRVSDAVWVITKKSNGMVKSYELYYDELAKCPIASMVKCADRNHNVQTMLGVFTAEKQVKYITEVETHYYPMIRLARRSFKKQYPAYENLKILLRCQCRLIEAALEASGYYDDEKDNG